MRNITIIVAYNKNFVIGNRHGLPWRIPDDLKYFKEVTMGKPCVMGRKTWFTIPKKYRPLPGRKNIVVSSNDIDLPEGVILSKSIEDAIDLGGEQTCIVGGGQIYRYCLEHDLVDRILASEIKNYLDVEGTVFFPNLVDLGWNAKIIKEFNDFNVIEYKK